EWDKAIISIGSFRVKQAKTNLDYETFVKPRKSEQILFYKDGVNTTVTVIKHTSGQLQLKVNGKVDATSRGDLPTQIMLGQLPLLLFPDAKEILNIGLGSGITTGSILQHPVEKVDVVEIAPAVVEAAHYFSEYNHNALKDPRVKVYIEDAKTFLKITPNQYDIIVSEPSNPWIAGIGGLFSKEYFEDASRKLRPHGLMVQWFHTYEMTDEIVKMVVRTFLSVFESVTVWNLGYTDIILIGSHEKVIPNFAKMEERFSSENVAREFRRINVFDLSTLLSMHILSEESAKEVVGAGPINEDYFPLLEYEAPKGFYIDTIATVLHTADERFQPRKGEKLLMMRYLKERSPTAANYANITRYYEPYKNSFAQRLRHSILIRWNREYPDDVEGAYQLAVFSMDQGDFSTAKKLLEHLIARDDTNVNFFSLYAQILYRALERQRSYLNRPDYSAILAALERCVELSSDMKDRYYVRMGQVYYEQGRYRDALSSFMAALEFKRNGQPGADEVTIDRLLTEVGETYMALSQQDKARRYFEEALKINRENPQARYFLEKIAQEESRGQS
ncbi:MAG: fused MFS/spermidine synthase, partial [Candidatus Tectomicrobia bacterium]|nr:fused MFS/spermidine synthase [Candidatus Tectomicrobia bacterium]